MAETKSEARPEAPTVKVGDFFECSWGYDQTNVDFYEVVALTPSGKSVKVRRVQTRRAERGTVPVGGTELTLHPEVLTKRLQPSSYHHWRFFVASYADAYLWDGQPAYETPDGMGH